MKNLFEHVGTRIRDLRVAYDNGQGLSQEKLAAALGVTTNTISRWETATYHPDLADLERLATFFGASILDFLPNAHAQRSTDENYESLLNTIRELEPEDIEEVRHYAEFRRARQLYAGTARPRPGRKPKPKVK